MPRSLQKRGLRQNQERQHSGPSTWGSVKGVKLHGPQPDPKHMAEHRAKRKAENKARRKAAGERRERDAESLLQRILGRAASTRRA